MLQGIVFKLNSHEIKALMLIIKVNQTGINSLYDYAETDVLANISLKLANAELQNKAKIRLTIKPHEVFFLKEVFVDTADKAPPYERSILLTLLQQILRFEINIDLFYTKPKLIGT